MSNLRLLNPFLEALDKNTLLSVIKSVLAPPLLHRWYLRYLTKSQGKDLPPQPKKIFLNEKEILYKIKSLNSRDAFLAVDELISLLPYSILRKIYTFLEEDEEEEITDILYSWASRIDKVRSSININPDHFYAEDDIKKHILLIMPSKKQLSVVKGRWTEWVWSPKTLFGEDAPSWEGWLTDLAGLADTLKSEGIKIIFAVDNSEKEEIIERLGKVYNYIGINMPTGKAKIGYARDQSVTWFRYPIICNMALDIRSGEEYVLNEIYWKLDIPPIFRPRWSIINGVIEKAVMEGGNFILVKGNGKIALFTGIGIRGTNLAALKALSQILPPETSIYVVPLSGYIRNWRETGTVHLDVAMLYCGEADGWKVMLVDPSRIGFYSVLKYNPDSDRFIPENLGQIAETLDITLDEPPRGEVSKITMTNALNLGGKKLVVDPYNKEVNRYLEQEWGFDLIKVSIPQLEAGGGGIRCSTRELFL